MLQRLKRIFRREPDFFVGGRANPYIRRWWVWPRNRWMNLYLHHVMRSDDDQALHSHPWWFLSLMLRGGYFEHRGEGWMHPSWGGRWKWLNVRRTWRRAGSAAFRPADCYHRIEMPDGQTAWTLVLTGRVVRNWDFACGKGLVPWQDFVNQEDHGNTGRGCGED